jgi:ABC-2 type transport system ATP-binding protein
VQSARWTVPAAFACLQRNVLDRQRWQTGQELRPVIVTWIERAYDHRRRQRALGKLTTIESEAMREVAHTAEDIQPRESTNVGAVPTAGGRRQVKKSSRIKLVFCSIGVAEDRANALGSLQVRQLVRTYRRAVKDAGLPGAVRHLIRPRFEEITAVAGIDLAVEPGESIGYVGPNGAGKSTTVKVLTGVLEPTAGYVRVNGLDPNRQRRENADRIGVVWGQRDQLWWDLPLRESFAALRDIYAIELATFRRNLDRLVEVLGIEDQLSTPVRQLSLGQRTRGNICAALLHDPAIVFLDEPTIGLDLFVKERVREALREAKRERGTTLVLTSHDLVDVEQLCERLIVLDRGQILYDGSLKEAVRQFATVRVLTATTLEPADPARLASLEVEVEHPQPSQLIVRFDERMIPAAQIVGRVLAAYSVVDLDLQTPSIEDVVRRFAGDAGPGRQAEP